MRDKKGPRYVPGKSDTTNLGISEGSPTIGHLIYFVGRDLHGKAGENGTRLEGSELPLDLQFVI